MSSTILTAPVSNSTRKMILQECCCDQTSQEGSDGTSVAGTFTVKDTTTISLSLFDKVLEARAKVSAQPNRLTIADDGLLVAPLPEPFEVLATDGMIRWPATGGDVRLTDTRPIASVDGLIQGSSQMSVKRDVDTNLDYLEFSYQLAQGQIIKIWFV